MNRRNFPIQKQRRHKINSDIYYPKVRVVGEGVEPGILNTKEAIDLAFTMGKDLILITENAVPPVAKIEDYSKFLYNQEKQEKERRKNSSKNETREIQLSVSIADNDLNTKAKKAKEFLLSDNKVKCVIQLKGRQKAMPEQGELVMLKFANTLADVGTPESMPKLDGGRWIMILKSKK
jgi:translation initiation factor IF-3